MPNPLDDILNYEAADYAIRKADDDRNVFGFASVIARNGVPTIDRQGDIILDTELQKAAHGYLLKGRGGKVSHYGEHIADPIESMVVTRDSSFPSLLKALNIEMPEKLPLEGWWLGFHVLDDGVWKDVKSGRLKSFSIGGSGQRVPV